jgi:hypothetical protein
MWETCTDLLVGLPKMSAADRELSALLRRSHKTTRPVVSTSRNALAGWTVDGGTHPAFDSAIGVYTAPRDALYAVFVQVLPCDGSAAVARDLSALVRPRTSVDYVLHVVAPLPAGEEDADVVAEELFDVGARSYGEVLHLAKGTKLAVLSMPSAGNGDSLRFKIDIVQRKRKRQAVLEMSAREQKKAEKKKKRAARAAGVGIIAQSHAAVPDFVANTGNPDALQYIAVSKQERNGAGNDADDHDPTLKRRRSESGSDIYEGPIDTSNPGNNAVDDIDDDVNDDEWSAGFSSDESGREDEKQGVGRIAKKLRTAGA